MKYLFFDGINRVLIPVDDRLFIGMVGKERHLFIGDAPICHITSDEDAEKLLAEIANHFNHNDVFKITLY